MPNRAPVSHRITITANLKTIADPHTPGGPKLAALADILGSILTFPQRCFQAYLQRRTKDRNPE